MSKLPVSVEKLIKLWSKLPGIGEKTARRMVFYVLGQDPQWVKDFSAALLDISENIHHCTECGNITDSDLCPICTDTSRDRTLMCVVETAEDCVAIEQAGIYNGLYHILGGHISPLEDEEISVECINKLKERIVRLSTREVILATTPRIEGDLTAFTIQEELKNLPVTVSRLSYGLPVGGSIGFADRVTLHMALESRKEM